MLEGWICPRCKRVNAPWVDHCDCSLKTNNINCCHQWVPGTVSTAGTMYVCAICGATKMEHYNTDGYVRNITNY